MPHALDPKLDVVFKLMFTRPDCEDLLVSLLTAVFRPAFPIVSVVVLNPDLEKETVRDRGVVLDLRVRLSDGTQVNVEMQTDSRPGMRKRALYHWARLYGFQLVRGSQYASLTRCACVFLLGYDELPSRRFHSTFEVLEVHDHDPLTDQLELHVVQLRCLPPPASEEWRQEQPLVSWGRFFVARNDREREELAMSNPVLQKAKHVLDEMSEDPEVRRIAREREEAFLLYQFELSEARTLAREEGEAKGREEGEAKGREEGEAKGLVEGQRKLLGNLARSRFGELPKRADTLIASATPDQITSWAQKLLAAGSLNDWLLALDDAAG